MKRKCRRSGKGKSKLAEWRLRYHQEAMKIAVASDHGGFPIKARIVDDLRRLGHDVMDLGTNSTEAVDYPDYAKAVAEAVLDGRAERSVLLCGSGAGACVAANKFRGIRSATCHDAFSAHQCVEDDDVNVLCLGARVVGPELALDLVRTYINARFSGAERHRRRLGKIAGFEEEFCNPRK
jgi:ribose 5-phosphate isomerase B